MFQLLANKITRQYNKFEMPSHRKASIFRQRKRCCVNMHYTFATCTFYERNLVKIGHDVKDFPNFSCLVEKCV